MSVSVSVDRPAGGGAGSSAPVLQDGVIYTGDAIAFPNQWAAVGAAAATGSANGNGTSATAGVAVFMGFGNEADGNDANAG